MALGEILTHSLSNHEPITSPATRSPGSLSKNLNRLLSAAVVSPRFQRLLLSDPVAALAAGYNGEDFQLTPAEYAAVTSLRVNSVRDFAAQLLRVFYYTKGDSALYGTETSADYRYAKMAT